MYQIRNLVGRSNVVSAPKNDMNACEDFFNMVLHSYVTSAMMKVLDMKEITR